MATTITTRQITAADIIAALGYTPMAPTAQSLAVLLGLLPGSAIAAASWTGIIIPYYQAVASPNNDAGFSALLTLIRSYPAVPVIVVVTQAGIDGLGGPGPYDAAMAQQIRLLQAAGAAVCGYVRTASGSRAANLVQTDILSWNTLYPSTPLAGVFLDQIPTAVGTANANVTLYQGYYACAHTNGYKLVIGNPGAVQVHAWYDTQVADIYCCYQSTTWPSPSTFTIAPPLYTSGAITDYPVVRFAGLIYNAAWNSAAYVALQPYLRWIYATDNPAPASAGNPWIALPTYLSKVFAAAAGVSTLTVTGTRVNLGNLPQSNDGAGLTSGDLYNNGGVLCIAP